ncbi:TIGR00725 family protein [Streptantibioticus ferralitis]|uniref:TIGR00725 family protein n=1 Tax=Streptantibioticus ferralitis TaxID=236510 RepID=A0ABT5Z8H4_9ACTN|nr:TIGR00725 family protein [Streptantibioticus ferralitis]MDF2260123.1 TIGR00725 family protein [Streptantibioticus ferralitis]
MAQDPAAKREITYVAVIGAGDASAAEKEAAEHVGALLAERGVVVVCGGLGGVMEAACRGVRSRGGTAVGLLPGRDRAVGNPCLSVALPTGLGELRNGLVVAAGDAVIAVGGGWGTLSEIALAMRTGKPTVVVDSWDVKPARPHAVSMPTAVGSAEEAVELALRLADGGSGRGDEG